MGILNKKMWIKIIKNLKYHGNVFLLELKQLISVYADTNEKQKLSLMQENSILFA